MIKFIIFTSLALISAFGIVWLFENNGTVLIDWLGYEVKSNVITAIIILIICHYVLVFLRAILSAIFSFNLKKIFNNWSKKRKLNNLTKSVESDKKSFELIFDIIKFLEEGNKDKALASHKELAKFSSNKELKEVLLAKVLFQQGELKKSQEIFSKLKIASTADFGKKDEKTLISKLKNFFTKN